MGSPFAVGHSPASMEHDPGPTHTDRPKRLESVVAALQERDTTIETPEPIDFEGASAVHTPGYLRWLRETCADERRVDHDTVTSSGTWDAVLAGAGGARWAVERAIEDTTADPDSKAPAETEDPAVAFALTRPPGHHALENYAMGFCFLNNAAYAAEHALEQPGIDTIAILDWDVHHGNGTESLFVDRSDVHYVSVHQDGLYPGTGSVDAAGVGDALGATANLPLPEGAGGPAFRYATETLLEPLFAAMAPDLVVLSAGFDAHENDPISDLELTTPDFGWLAGWTRDLAATYDAPVATVLEGGYQPGLLAETVAAAADAIETGTPPAPEGEPTDAARRVIDGATDVWPALG